MDLREKENAPQTFVTAGNREEEGEIQRPVRFNMINKLASYLKSFF